jgi:uncharacterized protein (TIGR03083 family)
MDVDDLIDQLEVHGAAFADAADRAGLDAHVPTCPGWDVRALLAHTGMVHRWATGYVTGNGNAGSDDDPERRHRAPGDHVVAWFRNGHAALVAALRGAPDELEAMTFLADAGLPRHFWARRQAHETAIHGADAAAALDEVPRVDAPFAVDGIGELLEGFYGRRRGTLLADPPLCLRIAPSDTDTAWLVELRPDSRVITRDGAGSADCTIRGSSPDLYLYLWNRRPGGTVEIDGDQRAGAVWRTNARVSWS